MATTTILRTHTPIILSSKSSNKASHVEDIAVTGTKVAPKKPSTPAWMAAADAEAALWDKAFALKGRDDYQSGDTCGYPFDLDYSKESKQQSWIKPNSKHGAKGFGHHL